MIFDVDDGDFGFQMSDTMGMDSDGNMMDSGELHLVSGWDDDDDDW